MFLYVYYVPFMCIQLYMKILYIEILLYIITLNIFMCINRPEENLQTKHKALLLHH